MGAGACRLELREIDESFIQEEGLLCCHKALGTLAMARLLCLQPLESIRNCLVRRRRLM